MKWIVTIISVLTFGHSSFAQDKKIDQLEILYDQGYYRKVVRKSKRLLADPEYDYSGLPAYYKSLSLFRLADDPKWFKRHKNAVNEAIASYEKFVDHPAYDDYVHAHYYEMASMKTYLDKLTKKQKELGNNDLADQLMRFKTEQFFKIKAKPDKHEVINNPDIASVSDQTSAYRNKIVEYAKTLLGVKYVWAGSDPSGFDCSGFTSYVLKKFGIRVPRTASGQMDEAKKVKLNKAYKGDLVFFGSGTKITHVGMVVSDMGDELSMIHASTSKGVIVTNIVKSTYWSPKLKAAGTYLE